MSHSPKHRLTRSVVGLLPESQFNEQAQAMQEASGHKPKGKLPSGYKIEDSGDPEARHAVIAPDGRTVTIASSKTDAIEIAHEDMRELSQLGRTASSSVPPADTPIQDQRRAAEQRADASGPTIRPTAAGSGKQAADPSLRKASRTTSSDATKKRSPKVGRAVVAADDKGKTITGNVTRKSESGGTVYIKDTGGKIHVVSPENVKRTKVIPDVPKKPRQLSNDPKQVARRAKRGFPNGH